jgi:hypothetical protein
MEMIVNESLLLAPEKQGRAHAMKGVARDQR